MAPIIDYHKVGDFKQHPVVSSPIRSSEVLEGLHYYSEFSRLRVSQGEIGESTQSHQAHEWSSGEERAAHLIHLGGKIRFFVTVPPRFAFSRWLSARPSLFLGLLCLQSCLQSHSAWRPSHTQHLPDFLFRCHLEKTARNGLA